MKITPKNLFRHELLGLSVEAHYLNHVFWGKVVAETRNMVTILTDDNKIKHLPKQLTNFIFKLPDGREAKLSGRQIVGRPYERIKMKRLKRPW